VKHELSHADPKRIALICTCGYVASAPTWGGAGAWFDGHLFDSRVRKK